MSERLPPEPSPAARELLRAFREQESPDHHVRERGWEALRERLYGGERAAANDRVHRFIKAAAVSVALAAAVLLAIKAVGVGVTALADQARQPAMQAPHQGEAGSDVGRAVARSPQVLPSRASTTVADEHEATVIDAPAPTKPTSPALARPARPRPGSPTQSPEVGDELQAELALIKRATQALKEHHETDGLAALHEHAERFPRGVMVDERMVLRAELFCASGRAREARALVESFLRERAGSSSAGRMRRVCREE